ncbi:hypothetical protein D3C84_643600 [compost metagenome]
MCLLKNTRPICNRPRECTFLVAKQCGIDQLGRNGATVDGDKRPHRAGPSIMNRSGKQLFASAGFAINQYRNLLQRQNLRLRLESQHALTLRDNTIEGGIHWRVESCELDELIGADRISRRDILGRDLKRHLNLLNTLLKRGLVKGCRGARLAQKNPHSLHSGCSGAEQNRQLNTWNTQTL